MIGIGSLLPREIKLTDLDIRRLAASLFRRAKLPSHVELEDIVQEMSIEILRRLKTFEPGRGRSLRSHLTYNARAHALHFIRSQQKLDRCNRFGNIAPRFEIAETDMATGADSDEFRIEDRFGYSAGQLAVMEALETLKVRRQYLLKWERLVFDKLVENCWDEDRVADLLYFDYSAELNIGSITQSRRLVQKFAARFAA